MISPRLPLQLLAQSLQPQPRLPLSHPQSVRQRIRAAVPIPRVNNQSAIIEVSRCSGELAQDQGTRCKCFGRNLHGFLMVARDVLVADQVHAVAGTADEADVRGGVQGRELVRVD